MAVTVEYSSSHGRLDMAVLFNDHVYLFEFKVVDDGISGGGVCAVAEAALRFLVPRLGAANLPDRRGVQQGRAQCRGV